jgi:glycerophosphoryl diester phosphodiesterase
VSRPRGRYRRGTRRSTLALVSALALGSLAASADASPYVHAHRGGSLATTDGVQAPRFPENTLPAFEAAAADGFVLELDVKLTSDRVPVVIHDATLDRTTDCDGPVAAIAASDLRAECEVDILGTAGNSVALAPGDPRRTFVPTLAEVLALANDAGASINVEIKNIPLLEPDFDLTDGFANAVVDAIVAARFPPSRLIVQSFWPLNLDVVERRLPGAETSLLTLRDPPAPFNQLGPAFAYVRGYEWVSPQWPLDPHDLTTTAYIAEAHALGLRIVPFTLDGAGAVRRATRAGVDAVITNDPGMARQAIAEVAPPAPAAPPPPTAAQCAAARAGRSAPPIEAYDPEPGAPRVFAIQPKQELRHVRSYASFRIKIECLLRDYVVPRLAEGRPNVVALTEDIGLMTIATGSRGALARNLFANPRTALSCEPQGIPCGVLLALAALRVGYAGPSVAYQVRFPTLSLLSGVFVAATDTFARGWMQLFSNLAKRYGVYILGSNNQAPFRESLDPTEISLFRDPDKPRPRSVYVATKGVAYNEVFMWGPEDIREEGPPMLRNVVAQNRKVPVTPTEQTLEIEPGAATGPDAIENVRPYALPGTDARIGFATSLPAFVYGHRLGEPERADPCSDVSRFYMQCLDELGTNLVIQDEANSGRWAGQSGEGNYQPLEWMRSTWRAAADPSVSFDYNVTPHLVGNLADLAFDGQTAITQRGLVGGPPCTYVGNSIFSPPGEPDPAYLEPYAGPKHEFLAIAPWVTPDAPRSQLRATAAKLAPGSRHPLENDYVETALIADLPSPPDPDRPSCVGAPTP